MLILNKALEVLYLNDDAVTTYDVICDDDDLNDFDDDCDDDDIDEVNFLLAKLDAHPQQGAGSPLSE